MKADHFFQFPLAVPVYSLLFAQEHQTPSKPEIMLSHVPFILWWLWGQEATEVL